ncbi:hypothetical protein DFH09DRAFT_1312722 [Mycena vulgaris]|nr:hypothetical protein DFH09DRAFT_1312722 [Mycena vulgaris]
MDECCGICCICVSCFGLITAAFRYLPFQSALNGCTCRCCCCKEDDDFDKIQFPDFQPEFTPTGERIRSYQPPIPMCAQGSESEPSPYDSLPLPRLNSPPPEYPTAIRELPPFLPAQPMERRPESVGTE